MSGEITAGFILGELIIYGLIGYCSYRLVKYVYQKVKGHKD